ncbi:polyisoprenoid-binding protein [Nocardioides marmoriginsengisoli]|uniref:Polyisoprenoid-binding protein n=1 Tax=Nocardioides marmoriginsengisoli TaxID=661483 RepID=A0A3N0CI75_9ACTN|nr:YceI family protein [Nocardioides marmoriginsengisoli]RNL63178.1 polyisoprenoid-binding protein [Nocardioides marmoriginsengisoli]
MTSTAPSTDVVAGVWTIDPSHSEVGFTVRHLMSKVRGQFEKFEGKLTTGTTLAETAAEATIDLNSINTRDEQRDGHLRSGDFFDTENTGPMTFSSLSFDGATAKGTLTIKGVAREVDLDVEFLGIDKDPWGGTRIGFEATTEISRKDFGVDFNIPLDGGKLLIGDAVKIHLAVEAVLEAPQA